MHKCVMWWCNPTIQHLHKCIYVSAECENNFMGPHVESCIVILIMTTIKFVFNMMPPKIVCGRYYEC